MLHLVVKRNLALAAVILLLGLNAGSTAAQNAVDALKNGFEDPPSSARPRVWWHWMNGNITQEGIKLDLEWMHRIGLAGFQNFDAALDTPQVVPHRLAYMTPEWRQAFQYATRLADQLNLEEAIAGSPGWSETGGPWVPPSQAMKKYVCELETRVMGGTTFKGRLAISPRRLPDPFRARSAETLKPWEGWTSVPTFYVRMRCGDCFYRASLRAM